jgi:hypothetical protein
VAKTTGVPTLHPTGPLSPRPTGRCGAVQGSAGRYGLRAPPATRPQFTVKLYVLWSKFTFMTAGALVVSLLGVRTSFQSGRASRQKSQCVSRLGRGVARAGIQGDGEGDKG